MKHLPITILFLVILSFQASAQFTDTIKECLKTKPSLSVKMDSRGSFISTRRAMISSVKIGLDYSNVFQTGIGFDWLNTKIEKEIFITDFQNKILDTATADIKLNYLSFYADYIFFRNERWEMEMPLSVGFGASYYTYDYKGLSKASPLKFCFIYEAHISFLYKFVPWAGVGAGIGYRIMPIGNKWYGQNYNSPVYVFRFRIFPWYIYHRLTGKNIKQ